MSQPIALHLSSSRTESPRFLGDSVFFGVNFENSSKIHVKFGDALCAANWSRAEAQQLGFQPGWFDVQAELIRRYKALPRPEAPQRARRPWVRCDCGHYSMYPMATARGTACEECYDRMSD